MSEEQSAIVVCPRCGATAGPLALPHFCVGKPTALDPSGFAYVNVEHFDTADFSFSAAEMDPRFIVFYDDSSVQRSRSKHGRRGRLVKRFRRGHDRRGELIDLLEGGPIVGFVDLDEVKQYRPSDQEEE